MKDTITEKLTLSDLTSGANWIHLAVENSDFDTINSVKKEELLCIDHDCESPLHYAAANNDVEMCKILLEKQPKLLNMKCSDDKTAYELALSYKDEYNSHIDVCNYFLGLTFDKN